jgi:hypothetical protein
MYLLTASVVTGTVIAVVTSVVITIVVEGTTSVRRRTSLEGLDGSRRSLPSCGLRFSQQMNIKAARNDVMRLKKKGIE